MLTFVFFSAEHFEPTDIISVTAINGLAIMKIVINLEQRPKLFKNGRDISGKKEDGG